MIPDDERKRKHINVPPPDNNARYREDYETIVFAPLS